MIRKNTKRFRAFAKSALATGLVILLTLGAVLPLLMGLVPSSLPVQAKSYTDGYSSTVWSSGFETSDPTAYTSKPDGGSTAIKKTTIVEAVTGWTGMLVDPTSYSGSYANKSDEGMPSLFDGSTGSKYLADAAPATNNPIRVQFKLTEAAVIKVYKIASANDYDTRDPKDWTLFGSNDGNNWTTLDSRAGITFSARQTYSAEFNIAAPASYIYYRFDVTKNNGANITQFSELALGTGVASSSDSDGGSLMTSLTSVGPTSTWGAYAGLGFTGTKAYKVYAQKTAKNASARNIVYDGLNIPVTDDMRLSYMMFCSYFDGATFDFDFTSTYMAVDLKFSDGSYLSDLGAADINGFKIDPLSQGHSDALYEMQWNHIEGEIETVAKGKTITQILVYFKMDTGSSSGQFLCYFDDISLIKKADPVYEHLSDYVNILRGTNGNSGSFSRGSTVPAVTMPNGFNFFVPVTNSSNQPYMYQLAGNRNTMQSMEITHMPSPWISDWGTWMFFPNTSVSYSAANATNISATNRAAAFSHDNEIAKPYYYGVTFDDGSPASGVKMEVTPTMHGAVVTFTFPANSSNVNLIFDCQRASGTLTFAADGKSLTAVSNHTNNGSRPLQIYAEFDKAYTSGKVVADNKLGIATFPAGTTTVTMKLATSYLSFAQAKKSLGQEITASDTLDTIKKKAQTAWDNILNVVEIEGASYTQTVTFYSNMYRLYCFPNLYSENEGTNSSPKWVYASPYKSGAKTEGKLYVNNGFWDTYRTTWSAYSLFTPTLDGELLDGLVQHYVDQGWVPRWIAPGGANSMVGTSSDIIFADAYLKGIDFNYIAAYESMLKNASVVSSNLTNGGRAGENVSPFLGYIPNNVGEGFSWSIESYINDYGLAIMAARMADGEADPVKKAEYETYAAYYTNRAMNYTLLFDKSAKFFHGKNADGVFGGLSNPASWWGDFTETNAWNMAFPAVYDGFGLAGLYGGQDGLKEKLDALFKDAVNKTADGSIHEMREARQVRLGQYGHSNQPSHHLPYMYNFAGAQYRTAEVVRSVMSRLYVGQEIGQGYLGDEDNGEMSAWYIFSALGFYPTAMATGEYMIGSPLFSKATIHLENGKTLTIIANNNSDKNIYIQSATYNGHAYTKNYITHQTIQNGGTIVFEMGDKPSAWGCGEEAENLPFSITSLGKPPNSKGDLLTSSNVTSTVNDLSKLIDNNSDANVTFASGSTVTVTLSSAVNPGYVTLTSGTATNTAPKHMKIEASNDGSAWTTVFDKDIKFEWARYTKSFAVDNSGNTKYKIFKITLTGGNSLSLSEIEFYEKGSSLASIAPRADYTDNPDVLIPIGGGDTTADTSEETPPASNPNETTAEQTGGPGATTESGADGTAAQTTASTTESSSGGGCKKKKSEQTATFGNSLVAFSPFVLLLGGAVTTRFVIKKRKDGQ